MASMITICGATLRFGERTLWHDLSLDVAHGEFIAILGPNGSGKTTLLEVLLGLRTLSAGSITIDGRPAGADNHHIGYIPQQKNLDRTLPLRGRDLVNLGVTGTRFGLAPGGRAAQRQVDEALAAADAAQLATLPVSVLSGGEQQRLRIAQAIVGKPDLLLCDEPLLSLDLTAQSVVARLLDDYRRRTLATILFVTHEINPILTYVDRICYIANGKWVVGTPDEVLKTRTLSALYGSPIDVLNVRGRYIIVGGGETIHTVADNHEEA